MDKISTEVVSHIITFLSLQDQLIAITVSKNWNELITTYNLYSRVDFEEEDKLNLAIAYFRENKEHIAKNMHHLTMTELELEDTQLVLLLPNLLPNV